MNKTWKELCTPTQVALCEELMQQLAEVSGLAAQGFERMLERFAERGAKFRYVWVNDDGEPFGTNDEDVANTECDGGNYVIDCVSGQTLDGDELEEVTPEPDDGDPDPTVTELSEHPADTREESNNPDARHPEDDEAHDALDQDAP